MNRAEREKFKLAGEEMGGISADFSRKTASLPGTMDLGSVARFGVSLF